MSIKDEVKARSYLANVNYYRLSAYWYTFLKVPQHEHKFRPEATFDKVASTYVFDRKLRLLLFDEIERIEIALKTRLIQEFSERFGRNWYEDRSLYIKPEHHVKFLQCVDDEISRTSEVFITHYRKKYDRSVRPPSWMAFQLVSFGQVSKLLKNLRSNDATKAVADHFGLDMQVLASWIESLAFVRNTCAHHARLWNRRMPKAPMLPSNPRYPWLRAVPGPQYSRNVYVSLVTIRYLLARFIPTTSFTSRLKELITQHPTVPIQYMGFTPKWEEEPLWS